MAESFKRLFSKSIFPTFTEEELFKDHMEGLNDPTLCDYQLLLSAALTKEEYKATSYENEYIQSYLMAVEKLVESSKQRTSIPNAIFFYKSSFALPILALSRHCVELTLKRAVSQLGGQAKKIHNLENLWKSFLGKIPLELQNQNTDLLNSMRLYVVSLSKLDETGTKLRYSSDGDELSQKNPLFVNVTRLADLLYAFVRQFNCLMERI